MPDLYLADPDSDASDDDVVEEKDDAVPKKIERQG